MVKETDGEFLPVTDTDFRKNDTTRYWFSLTPSSPSAGRAFYGGCSLIFSWSRCRTENRYPLFLTTLYAARTSLAR